MFEIQPMTQLHSKMNYPKTTIIVCKGVRDLIHYINYCCQIGEHFVLVVRQSTIQYVCSSGVFGRDRRALCFAIIDNNVGCVIIASDKIL